ncbi:ABC transporter substrate-binding protein [Macrococcus armenti]|uniref:ABC transporter substrate-binding protein n=1 Tax=Macrococcus armenti TaxID=2875764 RepID=UPI001CCBB212|nr:ABC transporter substrate-binding protein [Macrococcus armenti]UBH08728.1 ABC transporter substrate-binding protein [Macrococcus armenti]UBH11026.1 ABC transporter substrate-binding protein [Macrococcus armenti]UBH15505.1 ABC transporter substrate-binding protein [Macrococcus armenti]UBH17865.1 ABC transporter substrate-binding protein [Macrococcus armenti]UBH20130.1 ABC transporter substrate-binding protein [Macrococcus armenti]
MKKLFMLIVACIVVLAACGSKETKTERTDAQVEFKTDSGKTIKIPKAPKRIVVMGASYVGNLIDLGVTPVGADQYAFQSDILKPKLKGVEQLNPGDIEKIAKLKPDLIISFDTDKDNKKYEKIAPTIPFTYTKHDYLEVHELLGKIVGKEKEAKAFVDKWNEETKKDGEEIKKHLGADKTYSIFQFFQKEIYVYGDNWGRGSEIIYQAFGLKMQDKIVKDVKPTGWKKVSSESLGQYAGDVVLVSSDSGAVSNTVTESSLWKNMDAVKNNRLVEYDAEDFWFNDPISLEHQRKVLKEKLMNLK